MRAGSRVQTGKKSDMFKATESTDDHVAACLDTVCVMDGLSQYLRQKRRIVTSGFYNPFLLRLSCVLSSSRLSDQQSAGAAKVPVSSTQSLHHSHSVLSSRAAAVLPADR